LPKDRQTIAFSEARPAHPSTTCPTLLEPVGQAFARIPPCAGQRVAAQHALNHNAAEDVRRTKCRTRRSKSYNMAGVLRKTRAACVHTFLHACGCTGYKSGPQRAIIVC